MKINSGIGGTGYDALSDYDNLDNFQSELHFWDELLANLRTKETDLD